MPTLQEQIAKVQEQQKLLKEKERRLKAQQKEVDKKAHTKLLIEVGRTIESILDRSLQQDDIVKLQNFLELQEYRGKFFSKAMNSNINDKTSND
jgi:hypothetical protein